MSQTKGTPTAPNPTPTPTGKPSKAQRFLEAWGVFIAKADRAMEQKGQLLSQKYDKVKDKLTGTMHEADAERRLQRLEGLVAQYEGDVRFSSAVLVASSDAGAFRKRMNGKKVTDWTAFHSEIGIQTTVLLERIELARKAETVGLAAAPKELVEAVKFVELALATEKLSDTERGTFQKDLIDVKQGLITAGSTDKKSRAVDFFKTTLSDALVLQQAVKDAIQTNARATGPLVLRRDSLLQRLSAAGDSQDTMSQRVEVNTLLRLAQGDISLCDYDGAKVHLDKAETALNEIAKSDPSLQKAMSAKEIVRGVNAQISRWELAKTNAENAKTGAPGILTRGIDPGSNKPVAVKIPEPALTLAEEARNRAGQAIFLLQDVRFMVENAPASAGVAAKKLIEYTDLMQTAIDLLVRATAVARNEKGIDQVGINDGTGATESEQKLAQAKLLVDQRLSELARDLALITQQIDPNAPAGGEAFEALEDIRGRWEKTRDKAIVIDQLQSATYLGELDAVARQVAKMKDAASKGLFGPEDLAFEAKVVTYRAEMGKLETVARTMAETESSRALKLGLIVRPPVLAGQADSLIRAQAGKRGTADDVTKRTEALELVLQEIATLLLEAAKPDTSGAPKVTPEELRRKCQTRIDGYTQRITTVVTALKDETVILSSSREERDAKLKYAEALKGDMAVIAAPMASTDLTLLRDVLDGLVKFDSRVVAFEAMAPGKKSTTASFADVLKKAKAVQEILTTPPLSKRQAAMKTQVDEVARIITNVATLDPAETMKTLTRLEGEANKAKLAGNVEHEGAKALAERCDKLWAPLQTPKDKKRKEQYKSYYDDLIRRIQALRDDVLAKDSVGEAPVDKSGKAGTPKFEADFAVLLKEVQAALSSDPGVWKSACDDGLVKSTQDDRAVAQIRYRLESMREVDIKLLREKAGDLGGDAKAELIKQIDTTDTSIAQALSELEKTRNTKAAEDMADALASRLKRLVDSPLGMSTRARNNLPAVEIRWKSAVKAYDQALTTAAQAVVSACVADDTEKDAARAVGVKFNEARLLLQAEAFASPVKRMSSKTPQPKDVAAAREEGLREVRRLKGVIEKHPVLRQLFKVPFGQTPIPLVEVTAALWDMETNLTISG